MTTKVNVCQWGDIPRAVIAASGVTIGVVQIFGTLLKGENVSLTDGDTVALEAGTKYVSVSPFTVAVYAASSDVNSPVIAVGAGQVIHPMSAGVVSVKAEHQGGFIHLREDA